MKKLLTILLLFISVYAFGQSYTPPINPIQVPTMTWYKNAQGMWAFRGSNLGWWLYADSLMVKRMIASAAGGVTSFNSRTGAVVPLVGDYSSFYYPLSSNPAGYLISSALTPYALDNSVVHLSGSETIAGIKTVANGIIINHGTSPVSISSDGDISTSASINAAGARISGQLHMTNGDQISFENTNPTEVWNINIPKRGFSFSGSDGDPTHGYTYAFDNTTGNWNTVSTFLGLNYRTLTTRDIPTGGYALKTYVDSLNAAIFTGNHTYSGITTHTGSDIYNNAISLTYNVTPDFQNGIHMNSGVLQMLNGTTISFTPSGYATGSSGVGNFAIYNGSTLSGINITANQLSDYNGINYLKASGSGAGALKAYVDSLNSAIYANNHTYAGVNTFTNGIVASSLSTFHNIAVDAASFSSTVQFNGVAQINNGSSFNLYGPSNTNRTDIFRGIIPFGTGEGLSIDNGSGSGLYLSNNILYDGAGVGYSKATTTATKDSTQVVLPTIAALQAYNGTYKIALVTDTLRGGGTPFTYVASGTDDNVVTFAATGKGSGHWVRQYDKGSAVDMRWGGLTNTNTQAANEAIVNGYITAHPSAYIAIRSAYLRKDSLTVTNKIRIYDQTLNTEVFSGQQIGKSVGSGGFHALVQGYQSSLPGRWYILPGATQQGMSNTGKLDIFGTNYENDIVNYTVLEHDFYNDYSLGTNGIAFIGPKGVGNYFGLTPSMNFGFQNNGKVPFKLQYYDVNDTFWPATLKGAWVSGYTFTAGDYVTASNHLYQAVGSGVAGASVPTCTTGTCSDGTITWTFIKDWSGSESNNFGYSAIFGDTGTQGLHGIPKTTRVQFLGDAVVGNATNLTWLNNSASALWTDATTLNGTDWRRTSSNGTNAFQRWETSKNYIQNSGLAWLKASRTITDNSATPNVDSLMVATFNNSSPTTITNFVGEPNQEITVQSNNTNTVISNSATITLLQSENLALTTGMSVVFQANASGVWRQNGPAIATATTGGLLSSTTQSWLGNKTNLGTFDATLSTTGSETIMSNNSNGGTAADARIGASNGTVNYQMIMRGTGFTTNANNAYSSVTGTGLLGWLMNGNQRMTLLTGGNLGIGVTAPTAVLQLKAGTATASTAPFKYTSGTLLTTAESGAKEFLTDKEYLTITTGAARKEVALFDIAGTSGRIPYETTNGRLTDASTLTFDGTSLTTTLASATTATTQTALDNSTKIATTAYVDRTKIDNVLTKTANYTILAGDFAAGKTNVLRIFVDATAGNVTITLPTAASFIGYGVYVTKTDNSVNTVTISPALTASTLVTQGDSKNFAPSGSTWYNQ